MLCCAVLQPALYEAFGLTVVEAMTCGLPTFATCNGGPSEIIKNGKSGFHIDPYHGDKVGGDVRAVCCCFEQCVIMLIKGGGIFLYAHLISCMLQSLQHVECAG